MEIKKTIVWKAQIMKILMKMLLEMKEKYALRVIKKNKGNDEALAVES